MNRLAGCAVVLIFAGSSFLAPGAASGAQDHAGAPSAKGLGKCWVGTWRDGHERETTDYDGHIIRMRYSGGDIDHFFARGVDKDSWNTAHPEYGTFHHARVKEIIRGRLTQHLHGLGRHRFRVTSGRWSKSATNTYYYKGVIYSGYLNRLSPFTGRYSCTATTLKYYNKKGKLTGIEKRISRTP